MVECKDCIAYNLDTGCGCDLCDELCALYAVKELVQGDDLPAMSYHEFVERIHMIVVKVG